MKNPFILKGYGGPTLFCDREDETNLLIEHIDNGLNTTLYSLRRMGKTGLIHHLFNRLEKKEKTTCIYCDIYATRSTLDFTNALASAIVQAFPQSKPIGKKFLGFIKNLRPIISFDSLTGNPQITFDSKQTKIHENTIQELFKFLDAQKMKIVVAFDEFQQISSYPQENTEALLRTCIQRLKNVNFIFCGSKTSMITEMFNSAKRPFYSSTFPMHIGPVDKTKYAKFIRKQFKKDTRAISDNAIEFILDWTKTHTWYVQAVCNKLFAMNFKNIQIDEARRSAAQILKEHENTFYQYRSLLTAGQWKLLIAIANEESVSEPTAFEFVSRYKLGGPSSVRRTLDALVEKEMVYEEIIDADKVYFIQDVFLSRWLASKIFSWN
jgi:uncharacterized protein